MLTNWSIAITNSSILGFILHAFSPSPIFQSIHDGLFLLCSYMLLTPPRYEHIVRRFAASNHAVTRQGIKEKKVAGKTQDGG